MHENEGGAPPKGTRNSKIATGCTQSDFAQRSTRSTRPRRKIMLEPTKRVEELKETWNNAVDYRIPGIPLSTVEQQETHRKDKVKQLIEKFLNHPNQESFLQDFKQTKEINELSKESQDLIADMNNTEICGLCDTSSKQQCPDCNTRWEVGCNCGRFLKSSQRPKELEKNNYDVTSIPGYVINKNSSHRAKHGPSERQRMYYKAKEMLQKARQEKHGSYSSILARWNNDYESRNSLSLIGWTEQDIMLFDRSALENHSYVATKAERIRNSTHWIPTLNQEGAQQPLNQRPDFAQAKRECKRLHDEHLARTQEEYRTIPRSQQGKKRKGQAFEGIEEYNYAVDPKTGRRFHRGSRRRLAGSFVLVNKLGSNHLEDEQLECQAFFMV